MDRRRFLLTSLVSTLATPRVTGAQQAGKVSRIDLLAHSSATNWRSFVDALRE
jgi:hypothetical protein